MSRDSTHLFFVEHVFVPGFAHFVAHFRRANFWATKNPVQKLSAFCVAFLSAPILAKLTTEQNSSAFLSPLFVVFEICFCLTFQNGVCAPGKPTLDDFHLCGKSIGTELGAGCQGGGAFHAALRNNVIYI